MTTWQSAIDIILSAGICVAGALIAVFLRALFKERGVDIFARDN